MGLAAVLDWCVLERVALDRARWRTEAPALADLPLSVNITVAEVGPELEKRIDAFLDSPGGQGTQLWVELTERAMILNADSVAPTLDRLRARGIGLALDDFGVGYSSLAHLHRLPIDLVKLDRAFLASVATAGPDFMAAVVDLCAGLDLQVVAEGVETYEQHQVVCAVGIAWAQGFFYAGPRGPVALASLLAAAQPTPPSRLAAAQPTPPSRPSAAQPTPPSLLVPGSGALSAPT